MKLTILGTGGALVTKYYNTCFVLEEQGQYLLVDGGGGNQLLRQLASAGIDWKNIKHIFLTHKHIDHILGLVWLCRYIMNTMNKGRYEGEAYVYGHAEVLGRLEHLLRETLEPKELRFFNKGLFFVPVEDGVAQEIIGKPITFFDIHSTKTKQYGFTMEYAEGKRLTCLGDEPYNEAVAKYVQGSTWLLHEAYCLYSEAAIYEPYEKHHSTVREACQVAEQYEIPNLVLYHTEEGSYPNRQTRYMIEGKLYYTGKLSVPEDLDVLEL